MSTLHVLLGPDTGRPSHEAVVNRFADDLPSAYSLIREADGGSRRQLVRKAQELAEVGEPVVVVGYTNAVECAEAGVGGHMVLLPDLPGHSGYAYPSAVEKLATSCRLASLVIVSMEEERALLECLVPGLSGKVVTTGDCQRQVGRVLSDAARAQLPMRKRVCIIGEDLRHAWTPGHAVSAIPGVTLDSVSWPHGAAEPDAALAQVISDADVLLCDWATRGAVWLSRHASPGQRLVVRLHGYELTSSWIGDLDPGGVDLLVVVSKHWRDQVLERLSWPLDRIAVVPNSVEMADLARPKHSEAQFHLGMLGWVPMLKRPDLAIEVLERLLRVDRRFVLHLRGDPPWAMEWLWERRLQERLNYEALLRSIGEREELRRSVRFEPYGADVAEWYRHIGWVLSLSDRESFHLAAVEGMATGAVPVVRSRDGADEVLGRSFVVADLEAAVKRIAESDESSWLTLSRQAQQWAERYDTEQTTQIWREVLLHG